MDSSTPTLQSSVGHELQNKLKNEDTQQQTITMIPMNNTSVTDDYNTRTRPQDKSTRKQPETIRLPTCTRKQSKYKPKRGEQNITAQNKLVLMRPRTATIEWTNQNNADTRYRPTTTTVQTRKQKARIEHKITTHNNTTTRASSKKYTNNRGLMATAMRTRKRKHQIQTLNNHTTQTRMFTCGRATQNKDRSKQPRSRHARTQKPNLATCKNKAGCLHCGGQQHSMNT